MSVGESMTAARRVGLQRFLAYLRRTFSPRRVHFECPAYNIEQFASGTGHLFQLVGCLPEHTLLDGRWWDWHIGMIDLAGPVGKSRAATDAAAESGRL